MTPPMIEKMARAMHGSRPQAYSWDEEYQPVRDIYLADVRAALQALSEPTEAMVEAGKDNVVGCCSPNEREAREIFTAMIAAARGMG